MKVTSLDNIDDKILDRLVKLYKDDSKIRITDERKKLTFGNAVRGYFLIGCNEALTSTSDIGFTFIWIHNNLWQYNYINVHCKDRGQWINPIELLNKLLKQ